MWRGRVCERARGFLGTPYVPRGRVKGVGVDCGGFLYQVYEPDFGPFGPYPDYASDWALHMPNEQYLAFILPYVKEVPCVQPGGFTLFHYGQNYAHAAIYLGDSKYIHAWGRQREGAVTISKFRTLSRLGKKPPRHFDPVPRDDG